MQTYSTADSIQVKYMCEVLQMTKHFFISEINSVISYSRYCHRNYNEGKEGSKDVSDFWSLDTCKTFVSKYLLFLQKLKPP